MTIGTAEAQAAAKAALHEFAAGLDGKRPAPRVLEMAARIANAALARTVKHDISFDDEECAVSFHLQLANGYIMLAELEIDGNIDASVYDHEKRCVKRMPKAAEIDIMSLFQE